MTNRDHGRTTYIAMFSGIDDVMAAELVQTIATKIPQDTETLYVLLSTSGGSVSDGFVIYNFLRALPYKIIMHNIGSVDSIGNVVFLAGEERYASRDTTFLIHRVKGDEDENRLNVDYLHEKMSTIAADETKIIHLFQERSRIDLDTLRSLFTRGEVKDTDFALECGIIHEVRELKLPQPQSLIVIQPGTTKS